MNFKEVRESLLQIDNEIQQVEHIMKCNFDEEMTYTMIIKFKGEAKENKQRMQILLDELKNNKKKLIKNLEGIALAYNEVEESVFIAAIIQQKDLKTVSDELNLSYEYVRHIVAKLKKDLETEEEK